MAIRTLPLRPSVERPRLRLLRTRRGWWGRFMDPGELFGFKVVVLASCFFLSALLGP